MYPGLDQKLQMSFLRCPVNLLLVAVWKEKGDSRGVNPRRVCFCLRSHGIRFCRSVLNDSICSILLQRTRRFISTAFCSVHIWITSRVCGVRTVQGASWARPDRLGNLYMRSDLCERLAGVWGSTSSGGGEFWPLFGQPALRVIGPLSYLSLICGRYQLFFSGSWEQEHVY